MPGRDRGRRTWILTACASALAVGAAVLILLYDNPAAAGTAAHAAVVRLRASSVAVIALVAAAQGAATVVFHTVTGNRVITPSIMGFDALYTLIQTGAVFFFGAAALGAGGMWRSAAQAGVMMLFAAALYGWLLGRGLSVRVTLLVGVVIGLAFRSVSTLMQRLLAPSDFDLLSARLFGNMSNADARYLPLAAALTALALGYVWSRRRRLDVMALGRDAAIGLGVDHRRELTAALAAVAALTAVSTTLVGPMTFFGFLAATATYGLTREAAHGRLLPAAVAVSSATLLGAYFTLRHVFYAAGLISVIIEFVGGAFFLIHLLARGAR